MLYLSSHSYHIPSVIFVTVKGTYIIQNALCTYLLLTLIFRPLTSYLFGYLFIEMIKNKNLTVIT